MFRHILILFYIFFAVSASENNKTKELEGWLKFGFTNGDVSLIAEYINKIEQKNYILEKRITNLEKSVLEHNKIIKTFLVEKKKKKKISFKKNTDITKFKPSVFITKKVALLYDAPNGKAYMNFPINYKFTAYEKSGEWIRVSGHFPNKKWRKMRQIAWIKEELVKKIR